MQALSYRFNLLSTWCNIAFCIQQIVEPANSLQQLGGRVEKQIIEKRVRMDKEPLENLLFRLFEQQVQLTAKAA